MSRASGARRGGSSGSGASRLDIARLLPRGARHALLQLVIWSGFALLYEAVRGLSARERSVALAHTHSLIRLEQHLHVFVEPTVQRHVASIRLVAGLADWSYWLAQFVVVAIVVIAVYVGANRAYPRLRDALIATNCIGLAGYLLFPAAPPRLVAGYGFKDTFGAFGSPTTHNGIIHLFANQYAAFPSVHAADALVLSGTILALPAARPLKLVALIWPLWLSFALVVSGNHLLVDIAAGTLAGALGWTLARGVDQRRARPAHVAAGAMRGPQALAAVSQQGASAATNGAGELADRSRP
jgi:membrane-associated phospholipid phosphatase